MGPVKVYEIEFTGGKGVNVEAEQTEKVKLANKVEQWIGLKTYLSNARTSIYSAASRAITSWNK